MAQTSVRTVDRSALRVNQVCIIGITLLAFVLGDAVGGWLLLGVAAVMLVGTAWPGLALFQALYRGVLRPAGVVRPDVIVDDPAPHRFAQGMGGSVLVLAFAALAAGLPAIGWGLGAVVVALAAVNLVFGFCAGCFVYLQLGRLAGAARA